MSTSHDTEQDADELATDEGSPATWAAAKDEVQAAQARAEAEAELARQRVVFIAGERHILRKDEVLSTVERMVKLTNAEVLAKGRALAALGLEIERDETNLKEQTAIAKGVIQAKASTRKRLELTIQEGKERRRIEVAIVRDDRLGEMVSVDLASGEAVGRRVMTLEERQLPLLDTDPTSVDADGVVHEGRRRNGGSGAPAEAF